jgi:hypothetical protein
MTAPSAGTFDITLNGDTASTQAFNITAATFQTNLEALSSVGVGNVTVVEDTDVYTITFAGTLANISTNTLTVDGTALTATNSHVLTAVHDGTTTWNISFTPALATGSLPIDGDALTFYPRKVEAKIGTGDINHTKNKDPIVDTNRGLLDGARAGTEQPMDVSFEFVYDWLRSSTPNVPTVDEVLEREGAAADWLTAAADPCEPYQVTLKVIDAPDCGSELAEVILYKYFLPQSINPSVDAAAVSVSGICVATKPVVYRVTNDSDVYGIIYE